MKLWENVRFIAAIIAQVLAAILAGGFAYFLARYYTGTENPHRFEYWVAAWLMLFYASGSSLVSALLAVSVKSAIQQWRFRVLAWPALFLGMIVIAFFVGNLVADSSSRT